MLLKDLLQDFKYKMMGTRSDYEVETISTDTEMRSERCLYIVLKPKLQLKNLPSSGGVAILEGTPDEKPRLPYILCNDIRRAMAFIYSRFYEINYKKLSFIGITGTNGKSTTLTLLSKILSKEGHRVGCIRTGEISIRGKIISGESYSMTTPDPAILYKGIRRMQDEGCDVVIMEVSSHSLALSKVAPIPFDYALFTGLSPEHLDFHIDIEEYYQTKKILFDMTRCAVINTDDEYGKRLFGELDIRKISFGVINSANATADEYEELGLLGSSFKFRNKDSFINIRLNLIGSYNVYNALGAITIAQDMQVTDYSIREAIKETKYVEGRFQLLADSPRVIVDYAHTERAFGAFLHEVRRIIGNGRLTVIFGCGGDRDKGKREKMGAIAEKYADKIILTSDNPRGEEPMNIVRDILRGIKSARVYINLKREEAVSEAIISATPEDTLVIVGKGAEKYYIDSSGYHKYDEIDHIKQALLKRGKNENKA